MKTELCPRRVSAILRLSKLERHYQHWDEIDSVLAPSRGTRPGQFPEYLAQD